VLTTTRVIRSGRASAIVITSSTRRVTVIQLGKHIHEPYPRALCVPYRLDSSYRDSSPLTPQPPAP